MSLESGIIVNTSSANRKADFANLPFVTVGQGGHDRRKKRKARRRSAINGESPVKARVAGALHYPKDFGERQFNKYCDGKDISMSKASGYFSGPLVSMRELPGLRRMSLEQSMYVAEILDHDVESYYQAALLTYWWNQRQARMKDRLRQRTMGLSGRNRRRAWFDHVARRDIPIEKLRGLAERKRHRKLMKNHLSQRDKKRRLSESYTLVRSRVLVKRIAGGLTWKVEQRHTRLLILSPSEHRVLEGDVGIG